jgi:hypothetical protein
MAGHVAHVGAKKKCMFWWERHKERDDQEDLDIGGRIILRWIL